MKRCALGVEIRSRDRSDACVGVALGRAIIGSTRWSCGSPASGCTSGVPSTTRARFLDVLVQRRLDSQGGVRLKEQGLAPKLLVADKLRSCAAAFLSGTC